LNTHRSGTPTPDPEQTAGLSRDRCTSIVCALGGFALAAFVLAPSLAGRQAFVPADIWMHAIPWSLNARGVQRFPTNTSLSDQAILYAPQLWVVRDGLRTGTFPLWNARFGCGEPMLPTALSGALAPTNLPTLLLPWPLGFAWSAWLRFGLMWAGAYALGRALRLGRGLSLGLAVGFCFAPGFLAHFQQPRAALNCWLPWLLLCVERVSAAVPRGPRSVLGASWPLGLLAFAILLGGHPHSAFNVLFATSIYAIMRISWRPRRDAILARVVAVAALGLGAALAAPILVPFFDGLSDSATFAERRMEGGKWVLPSEVYQLYWNPLALGSPVMGSQRPWSGSTNFEEEQQYVGMLPWVFLLGGLFLTRRREREDRARFAALAATAFVCTSLAYGWPPLHGWLTAIPPFSFNSNPRLVLYAHAALVLGAGIAARGWLIGSGRRAHPAAWALLGTAAAAAVLVFFLGMTERWEFRSWIVLGATLLLFFGGMLAATGPQRRAAAALVPLLLLADLAPVYARYHPAVPRAWADPARAVAELPRVLRADPHPRVAFQDFTPSNLGALLGATDVLAYSFPVSRRYDAFTRQVMQLEDSARLTRAELGRPDVLAALTRTCATWVLTSASLGPDASAQLEPMDRVGPAARLYRLRHPAAWAAWHSANEVAVVEELASSVAAVRADLDRTPEPIVVEAPDARPATAAPREGIPAEAHWTDPRRIEVSIPEAAADEDGWLVMRVTHDPGWTAVTENGEPLRVLPAQVRFLAVEMPAGTRRVLLRYAPPHFGEAWAVAAAGLVGLAGIAIAGRRP
jgi:hypothetical protein